MLMEDHDFSLAQHSRQNVYGTSQETIETVAPQTNPVRVITLDLSKLKCSSHQKEESKPL